jgi:hypothetical protein
MEYNKELAKIIKDDNKQLEIKILKLEEILMVKVRILRKENEMLKNKIVFLTNLIDFNEAIIKRFIFS